jgi:uncharacterized protein (TIGR03437 family)
MRLPDENRRQPKLSKFPFRPALRLTVAVPASWLTVSPAGSLSGAQSLSIAANHTTIDTSQYGISYLGGLYLTSGNVTQTVRVTLNVAPPLTVTGIRPQPDALNFASEAGSSRASQDLVITHSPLGYMPIVLTYEGGAWLKLATFGYSPLPSGSPWYSSESFRVLVDPAGLSPGFYRGSVTATPAAGEPITVPVTFRVTSRELPPVSSEVYVLPPYVNFSYTIPGRLPSPVALLILSIASPGQSVAGTIKSAVATPVGGKWLKLVKADGTAIPEGEFQLMAGGPAISADPTGLPPGTYTASVTVEPTGGQPVVLPITLTVVEQPVIRAIANAASFGAGAVAPGEVVTIGGSGLGPADPITLTLDTSGRVSTSQRGISVWFNGYPAPLIYASPSQINSVVPYEVDGAPDITLEVDNGGRSAVLAMKGTAVAPAIFTANGSGSGLAAAAYGAGGTVTLYLTGEGQTSPRGVTGKVTSVSANSPVTPQPVAGAPTVTIGGKPATVLFYGEAPGLVAGIMQLNVQIPAGLSGGNHPIVVAWGSVSSQNGVTVSLQ